MVATDTSQPQHGHPVPPWLRGLHVHRTRACLGPRNPAGPPSPREQLLKVRGGKHKKETCKNKNYSRPERGGRKMESRVTGLGPQTPPPTSRRPTPSGACFSISPELLLVGRYLNPPSKGPAGAGDVQSSFLVSLPLTSKSDELCMNFYFQDTVLSKAHANLGRNQSGGEGAPWYLF